MKKIIKKIISKLFYPLFKKGVLKVLQSNEAQHILFADNKTDKAFDLSVYKLQSLSILKNIQNEKLYDNSNHEDSL
jgi:hypothetical protein